MSHFLSDVPKPVEILRKSFSLALPLRLIIEKLIKILKNNRNKKIKFNSKKTIPIKNRVNSILTP